MRNINSKNSENAFAKNRCNVYHAKLEQKRFTLKFDRQAYKKI